jgi:hypothetical protein
MNYLEWLRNGSDFHEATPVRGGRVFSIVPANDTPECHVEFDGIVETASVQSHTEWYSIKPHRQHMHGGYKYDFAIIVPHE